MERISSWRLALGAAFLVALGGAWGCAQDVGDIDRTQADKIDKELFQTDDEWYLQQTVVDTGMEGANMGGAGGGAMMAFPALESELKRIRWTVTEDILYAHSTVELAEGLNEGFDEEDARREGVVAAFPIVDHFDVQRQYSSSTGEPTNVITEDRSDREWYDRDYMRVDWGRNLVDGFQMFQGMLGSLSPADYNVPQDDSEVNPNRTRIGDELIDTVTEYSYDPDIYACYGGYGMDSIFACEGGRVSVRTSMKPVPQEDDYEPMNYLDADDMTVDGERDSSTIQTVEIFDSDLGYRVEVECNDMVRDWLMQNEGSDHADRCGDAKFDFHQRFGYFRTERVEWDRYVGTSDDQRRYYVNRWNIWETMLDDDGETLPFDERTPKPITFHLNVEYPEFMFDAAETTAEEWNDVFRDTVKTAMEVSSDELDEILEDEYGHDEMFRIVQNSCHPEPLRDWYDEHGDSHPDDRSAVVDIFDDYIGITTANSYMENALWDLSHDARTNMCAELEFATEARPGDDERFSWERVGDIRYSFFNWVEEETGVWAGYGPSAADPKTGEIIRANANYAGKNVRQNATYAADLIQYFNGELSQDDILSGVQIRDDLFNNDRDTSQLGLEPEEQREMAMRSGVDPNEASATNYEERPELDEIDPFIQKHGIDKVQFEAHRVAEAANEMVAQDERMVAFLEEPEVKDFLLNSAETVMAVQAAATGRHGENYDDEQFHQAYLDFHTPRKFHERRERGEQLLSERSIMTSDSIAQAAEQLVTYQGAADFFRGQSRDDIKEYFLKETFIGTQLHEIGHAVGLRHNFSGHADALNYHDEFWEIEQAVVDGELTRDEAYSLQGDVAEEILGEDDIPYASQAEYKVSSVMDYTADLTGRFAGLGKYDRSAIKFAYGEHVEQWDDSVELPNAVNLMAMISDYRELPLLYSEEAHAGAEDAFAQGVSIIRDGREFVSIDDARQQRRDDIRENTSRWESYQFDQDSQPAMDRSVEYEFCSDEFRGRRLDCHVFAYGGNQQEMVNHAFDSYRAFQTFWRHRRHNIDRNYDNLNTYMSRLLNTFQISAEPFRYFSIYRWTDLGDYTEDLMRASIDGFNFYNEIFSMPEPGRHCKFDESLSDIDPHWFYSLDNTYVPAEYHVDEGQCDDYIDIPRGVGHEYDYSFTDEYQYRIDRIGSYIDKVAASQMMFDISADFAQSAFFTDFRATNISYWTIFQDEMLDMMSGVLLGDYQRFGARVNGGKLDVPQPVDPSGLSRYRDEIHDGTPRVFTPQSVNHEFNLLAGGFLYNSTWQDRAVDFTHYVKVATTEQESQEFGEGVDTVEFVHPDTQQVYTAADIEERSVGARMIERTNELADRYVDLKETRDEGEANGEMSDAQLAELDSAVDQRREQMQDMVARMDMSRFAIDATQSLR